MVDIVQSMSQHQFWTTPSFIENTQVEVFKTWGLHLESEGRLKKARIGKGVFKKVKESIRSDEIHWIDDFESPAGAVLSHIYTGLLQVARRELFLPIKRFECHFAKYDKGDHYKKHRDRHRMMPARVLSCVLYLSTLNGDDGGELILYHPDGETFTIHPEAGRMILFDSSIEHEVRPCKAERWSITGWLRTDPL